MNTASEIKRFQDKKSLGTWFDILLPLVQPRVSCQPEQGVEPSTCTKRKSSSQLALLMILRVMKMRQQVLTSNQLQVTQGNVILQHPNPTSVPVNQPQQSHTNVRQQHSYPASMPSSQFRQSLANTVQQRQHADPSSMPTNQLRWSSANKMQPKSTNQTTTANIQLYPASSNRTLLTLLTTDLGFRGLL